MAGTNGEDDMLSNARNAGSRTLHGEGGLIDHGLLTREWSRRGGEENLSMDSDHRRLRGTVRLPGRGMMVVLRKATLSSHKAALVDKNEAICC